MDLLFYTHESKLYGLTIFVSIVTFQIVYVFVQWLIKHRRDYLFYIAYLFFVIVFVLSHYDKYLNFYPFSGIAERYYEYINLSAPLLCILLYFRFMREFLNLKHRRPDINTMVKNLEFFLIAYTLLSPFFIWLSLDIAVWKMIFNVVAIITITAGLFIIINFLKKSIPLDRFAMTGASLIAVGSIFDIALSFLEFRGFNIPFDIHLPLMVCVIGELTTFTLGLAFKTQFVENEKLFVEKNFLSEKSEKQQLQLDILKLRNNLARELHDDIGAQLSLARMLMSKARADGNERVVDQSMQLLEESINKLRSVTNELENTTLQNEGFQKATEKLLSTISEFQPIHCNFYAKGVEKRLHLDVEYHLFRITQELINNTLKYAHASIISIIVLGDRDKFYFIYEDNGLGFDLKNSGRGKGLNNILQRVKELGTKTEFIAQPGGGMRCEFKIDYEQSMQIA